MPTSAVRHEIPILRTTGTGGTSLAAFHDALVGADLGHYNLVRLSSVVPPDTAVDATGKAGAPSGAWGDKLYCVYAEQRATEVGQQAWAGIGWVQRMDGRGGLFVEHEGTSEAEVEDLIRTSLASIVGDAAEDFSEPDWVLHGAVCAGEPVCAMVIAPYETETWRGVA
jgi:arginine decarboxylase